MCDSTKKKNEEKETTTNLCIYQCRATPIVMCDYWLDRSIPQHYELICILVENLLYTSFKLQICWESIAHTRISQIMGFFSNGLRGRGRYSMNKIAKTLLKIRCHIDHWIIDSFTSKSYHHRLRIQLPTHQIKRKYVDFEIFMYLFLVHGLHCVYTCKNIHL